MKSILDPVTLSGNVVFLEPLAESHAEGLFSSGKDPSIWTYLPYRPFDGVESAMEFIRETRRMADSGSIRPFAIRLLHSREVVGTTRFMDIRIPDRGVEIGGTWVAREFQRTGVNTECKYLLLRHAFESAGAVRVQLKTDGRNLNSQRAIERIGAVREGVLRRHMALPDGFIRDTVYFSILDYEWPAVKARLNDFMAPNPNRAEGIRKPN